jgi:hypothetical protein
MPSKRRKPSTFPELEDLALPGLEKPDPAQKQAIIAMGFLDAAMAAYGLWRTVSIVVTAGQNVAEGVQQTNQAIVTVVENLGTTIGGAIIQTPQTTVMMSSAPTHLGGVVSAVKASVGGTFYGLGAALFSMFGIILLIRDIGPKLADAGVSIEQAGEILSSTAAQPGAAVLDSERTAWVISEATTGVLSAAHTLNLAMTVIPVAAAILVLVLFRRRVSEPYSASQMP